MGTSEDAPQEKTSVVLPANEVRLMSGERVSIEPWSLALGRKMRKRLTEMFEKARELGLDGQSLPQLFDHFEDEIYYIVRDTIDKDDEWMNEHLKYEDLFTLAQGVVDTCILREGGGGALGKLLGAMGGAFGGKMELPPDLAAANEAVRREARGDSPETQAETRTTPSGAGSRSSQGGGAQLPVESPKS